MKKLTGLAAALAATALAAASLGTVARAAPPEALSEGPGPGGVSSDNIEWIKNIAISFDGVGGRLVGDYFYTNDQNKMMILDVSDPLNPRLTGFVPMPQEFLYSREDIDTNGKIMVLPQSVRGLHVIDVEDKSNPQILATVPGNQHTQSCILDCTWAYGSDGNIHDLRDPSNPKLLQEKWNTGKPGGNGHDVTEVSRGMVLTATQPMMLLDARKNPANPKVLALGANEDFRFIHSVLWPRKGKDKFILAGGETLVPRCSDRNGAFMVWDASKWKKTKTFTMTDEYRMANGTYTDGNPPVNPVGCSSHWLQEHPEFKNGGVVAAAFFDHGTRLMDVSSKGKIKEIGYFMPWGGSTGAVYWITDEILYAVDYTRGIDILRYTGKK